MNSYIQQYLYNNLLMGYDIETVVSELKKHKIEFRELQTKHNYSLSITPDIYIFWNHYDFLTHPSTNPAHSVYPLGLFYCVKDDEIVRSEIVYWGKNVSISKYSGCTIYYTDNITAELQWYSELKTLFNIHGKGIADYNLYAGSYIRELAEKYDICFCHKTKFSPPLSLDETISTLNEYSQDIIDLGTKYFYKYH